MFTESLCIKAASHVREGSRSRRQGYEGGPPCHCGVDHRAKDPQLLETLEPEHNTSSSPAWFQLACLASLLLLPPNTPCKLLTTMIAIAAATLP